MNIVLFDESNSEHYKAFDYFAYTTGHPYYIINGIIEDSDIGFREYLAVKFNLGISFVDDCNGSTHFLISRRKEVANFEHNFCWDNGELDFSYTGNLYFNEDDNTVIFCPDLNSIVKI